MEDGEEIIEEHIIIDGQYTEGDVEEITSDVILENEDMTEVITADDMFVDRDNNHYIQGENGEVQLVQMIRIPGAGGKDTISWVNLVNE